jgi:hypothetical protein
MALQSATADGSMWGIAKTGMQSQYLGRIGSVIDDSPSSVTEMTLGYGDMYGGVWNAKSFSHKPYGENYGDEIDLYGGWARTFGPIKLDVMATYYYIAQFDHLNDDMWAIEYEIAFHNISFVQPYIRARYFGEVGDSSPHGGMFYFMGLRKNISLGTNKVARLYKLNLDASTAYADGAFRKNTGFVYGRLTTSVDIPLWKRWTLSPSFIYQVATPDQRNDPHGFTDGNKIVVGATLAYSF